MPKSIGLIITGLVSVPFFFWPGYDTREPKMLLALAFAFCISLCSIYRGGIKAIKNKWLLFFLGYLLLSIYFSPKPMITLFNKDFSNFWVWKPMFDILVFFLMFLSISGIDFSKEDIGKIFMVMVWVGFVMAIYCILQALGIDQFYDDKGVYSGMRDLFNVNHICGTLGNATIVSPFIAMLIPMALFLKRYFFAIVMFIAVCLTRSQVAIGAMLISLLFLFSTKGKKQFISSLLITIILISSFTIGYFKNDKVRNFINDKNRFKTWYLICEDLITPITIEKDKGKISNKYPFTGFGMGTYSVVFPIKHNTNMGQAHNDYLELAYNTGIIGFSLFLGAIFYMFIMNLSINDIFTKKTNIYITTLLSSFVCIAICAAGTFVWQLGATIFYSVIIAGLLHNDSLKLLKGGLV